MPDHPSDVKSLKEPEGNFAPSTPGSEQKPATPDPAQRPYPTPTPGAEPKPGVTPTPGEPKGETVPLAALMDERGKRQTLEAEVTLMKQQQQVPGQQMPGTPMQQPPNNQMEEIDKLWDTDPRKGVQAEIMMAINWFDQTNNAIDHQADALSGKYADFSKWRSDATRYVRGLPLNQRSQQGVLEMAYFIVRGQNVDGILKQQNDDLMAKFQTGELAGMISTPPGTVGSPAPVAGVQATQDQVTAATAMGMTIEDYMSNVKPGAR